MIRKYNTTTTLAEIWDELLNDYRTMTVRDVDYNTYRFHHEILVPGYVSRRTPVDDLPVYEYHGRFGDGYIVYLPNYKSTRYCRGLYYIKEAHSNEH